MANRRYSGQLYYSEPGPDHMDFPTLIVRDSALVFVVASVTADHGRWEVDAGKHAELQPDGSYLARDIWATQDGVRCSDPWTIRLRVVEEVEDEFICLKGEITEGGQTGYFDGELEAVKA